MVGSVSPRAGKEIGLRSGGLGNGKNQNFQEENFERKRKSETDSS